MSDILKNEIQNIAKSVIAMEQEIRHLDLLELEILEIKKNFRNQEEQIKQSILTIIAYLMGQDDATEFLRQKFQTDRLMFLLPT